MKRYTHAFWGAVIWRDGEEIELFVHCAFTLPQPAILHLAPEDCRPAEDGDFDIIDDVCDVNGDSYYLTDDEFEEIERYFWEKEYGRLDYE